MEALLSWSSEFCPDLGKTIYSSYIVMTNILKFQCVSLNLSNYVSVVSEIT